jgi:hypothetical protein
MTKRENGDLLISPEKAIQLRSLKYIDKSNLAQTLALA